MMNADGGRSARRGGTRFQVRGVFDGSRSCAVGFLLVLLGVRSSRSRCVRRRAVLAGSGAGSRGPIRPRPIGPIRARLGCGSGDIRPARRWRWRCRSVPPRSIRSAPGIEFDQHGEGVGGAGVFAGGLGDGLGGVLVEFGAECGTPNSGRGGGRRCRGGRFFRRRAGVRRGRRSGRR